MWGGISTPVTASKIQAALASSYSWLWSLLRPQTAAETAASVTPTNYQYKQGNVLRYGSNAVPGTTDLSSAVTSACAIGGEVFFPPNSTYHLASAVPLVGDVSITAEGAIITGGGEDSNTDLFASTVANVVTVRGGTFTDCRFSFNFTTAFGSLDVSDAKFSASPIPILIHNVASGGFVSVKRCEFENVEIGVDLQSSPIARVDISENRFINIGYKSLTLRPSPLDKKIVSGLWYQAIAGAAGASSVDVSHNYVNGVTGPSLAEANLEEVHCLAVSLDQSLECDILMSHNNVSDSAGHSSLSVGDEGLLARGRNVIVCDNILRDAGSTEGMIYAKGTDNHQVLNNTIEATAAHPRLAVCTGLISTGIDPIVNGNKFIGMPEGIVTRATRGKYSENEFTGITSNCISMRMEEGVAHEWTIVTNNTADKECDGFFVNETSDGSTATYGDFLFTGNRLFNKGCSTNMKAAANYFFEGNYVNRMAPSSQREVLAFRANKTISCAVIKNNHFSSFESSALDGRVLTPPLDAGTGKAGLPRLCIEGNYFGSGVLAIVLSGRTYDDLIIKGNAFMDCDAISEGALTINNTYVATDNVNANVDTRIKTTASLEDAGHFVNTSDGKVAGECVFNTTTNKPVYATGAAASDPWADAAGATAHTPV